MSPAETYSDLLKARNERAGQYEAVHVRFGNAKLGVAVAGAVLLWLVIGKAALSAWWLLAPLVAYLLLAQFHTQAIRKWELARRAVAVYERGLARIEDRWAGVGETGTRFADPHHVYSADLDLFGNASLFQLLSTARTRIGEETLARWLLVPARIEDVQRREACVAELAPKLQLREDIAVLGEDARVGVHPEHLVQWAEAPRVLTSTWSLVAASVLGVLAIAGAAVWYVSGIGAPFIAVVIVEGCMAWAMRRKLGVVTHTAEHVFADLDLLAGVLARLEQETFEAAELQRITSELGNGNDAASVAITRLRKLVGYAESRHNFFIRMLDVPLMYSVQIAYAMERWRTRYGASVRGWLDAVGEAEALASIATYTYEHPADRFPEFAGGAGCFEAEGLCHPLIPATKCVANDVSLSGETRVLLVSGSNMSGKSTLLRSVGLNAVLAMAGAPVRAKHLRMSPLKVGASLRVSDSLQEGSSRFYAEITRLRQIVDLAGGEVPLVFLVDEFLQGTNSRDRRIGAEALIRELVAMGAIGLVTTHDLALTEVPAELSSKLRNVHFQDYVEDGKIHFDYKLRDGVVAKSNGLELMRSIGLDV